jgi:Flp pilus assembly protein TadG
MSLLQKLRHEDGELGMLSALLLLAGVLLPIMFIVVAFARIENGRLAAAQAARDAVRAAVEAPTSSDAQQAGDQAIARAQTQTGVTLQLHLDGTFARGAVLQVQTSAQIALASVPFIGQLGTITVHGSAAAPVDTYRSLIGDSSP